MVLVGKGSGGPVFRRSGGWLLVAGQFGFAVWFAVCVCLVLARAAEFAGHWYVPSANDQFTANADVFRGWAAGQAVAGTMQVAPLVALLSIVTSALLFIGGYPSRHRVLTFAMIGGVTVTVLTLAVELSPLGRSIAAWLID